MKKYLVHIGYLVVIICLASLSIILYQKNEYQNWKMDGMLIQVNKMDDALQKAKSEAERNAAEASLEKNRAEIEKENAMQAQLHAVKLLAELEQLKKKCGS